jgi:hypothetical protein
MNSLKVRFLFSIVLICLGILSCSNESDSEQNGADGNAADQNLLRSIELVDAAIANYFTNESMSMARYYNPYTQIASQERASVWMYTSAIEAVNAILKALRAQNDLGYAELYDQYNAKYVQLLEKLFAGLQYYKGTFRLVSYTQTKEWSVYAVNRAGAPGTADVSGVLNVYDDQQWLVRELLESYHLTGNRRYLEEAEYLAQYVLDGWDCTLNAAGKEHGGITWGPGYVSKHSCSNGPFVSPLVWLHEIYKDSNETIEYRYIKQDKSRAVKTVKKSEYYLEFAKKVYDFQKNNLLRNDGVYDDMLGGDDSHGQVVYEEVGGQRYRRHTGLSSRVGPAYSYNSGTMLSGAADLYRVVRDSRYLSDLQSLVSASFRYFARLDKDKPGLYSYDISGFSNWFNGVLMRGYLDAYPHDMNAETPLLSFQDNLDYSWEKYMYESMLPTNLLLGWGSDRTKQNVEGMFIFTFAAEYAALARFKTEF